MKKAILSITLLLFAATLYAQTTITATTIDDPSLQPPAAFTVEVWAHNVTKLFMYQFMLEYDPAIIECVNYTTVPPFNPAPSEIGSNYVAVSGYTYFGDFIGVTADYVLLAVLTFEVTGSGVSKLDFIESQLYLMNIYADPIDTVTVDGYFSNMSSEPVAVFTVSKTTAFTGETITFDASASYDPDGSIVSYNWNFGDGSTATGSIVTHAYLRSGTYTVTLTVTDDRGKQAQTNQTITIGDHNKGHGNDPDHFDEDNPGKGKGKHWAGAKKR